MGKSVGGRARHGGGDLRWSHLDDGVVEGKAGACSSGYGDSGGVNGSSTPILHTEACA